MRLLNLSDKVGISKDILSPSSHHSNLKTSITCWYTDTGEEIFRSHNMMTLAGGSFIARALFNFDVPEKTPTYNTALSLDDEKPSSGQNPNEKVYLFCVGTDGCGRENSQVRAVKYASWISPDYSDVFGGIVPFRYCLLEDDLPSGLRDYTKSGSYFGRKEDGDRIAYYFKQFDSEPLFTQQFTDGTPIDANVYKTQEVSDTDVESVVYIQLSITKDDCRDFFLQKTGINDSRINSLSLCTGYPDIVGELPNGVKNVVYQNIRPVTRLNFPNESLIDLRKSITINYSIYF